MLQRPSPMTLDCTVVSVGYRLGPETMWQGVLEDTCAAHWRLHDQASEIGVKSARIAVMRESAGDGLTRRGSRR